LADEIMTKGRIRLWSETTAQSNEIVHWLRGDGTQRLLLHFRDPVLAAFPVLLSRLDGIRSAAARTAKSPERREIR
jgi:hypothetical protein